MDSLLYFFTQGGPARALEEREQQKQARTSVKYKHKKLHNR